MNPWLQIFAAENARGRIVCLPRAGGTSADFAKWGAASDDIEVCAVQLPGRLHRYREPAVRTTGLIVQGVVQALYEREYLPLLLFGDCMGALLAFEIAREIRRASLPLPVGLVVASYAPPDQKRTSPNFHDAPAEVFRNRLLEVGGLDPEVIDEDELFELLLPSLRADFELFENYEYVPEPLLEVDIYAIGGQADPHVSLSDLEGWGCHTCRRFEARRFAGDHFFLRDNPSVIDFIKEVALRDEAQERIAR
ncbi:MAG TPA: thioesterase domain-containing protein [Pyrinomonadaceae bacterium]|nr:thioesterase domain-containing protein [Pyrinomonadaceae bacterium]